MELLTTSNHEMVLITYPHDLFPSTHIPISQIVHYLKAWLGLPVDDYCSFFDHTVLSNDNRSISGQNRGFGMNDCSCAYSDIST